jgi:hypothetical protein
LDGCRSRSSTPRWARVGLAGGAGSIGTAALSERDAIDADLIIAIGHDTVGFLMEHGRFMSVTPASVEEGPPCELVGDVEPQLADHSWRAAWPRGFCRALITAHLTDRAEESRFHAAAHRYDVREQCRKTAAWTTAS